MGRSKQKAIKQSKIRTKNPINNHKANARLSIIRSHISCIYKSADNNKQAKLLPMQSVRLDWLNLLLI